MRRAVLVVLLFCVCSAFGHADSDRNRFDRPGEQVGGSRISLEARRDFPTADNPRALASGDFNRDGVLDLATVSPGVSTPAAVPDTVTVLLGTGDGEFRRAPDVFLGSNAMAVAIAAADFDRDTRIDLAVLMQRGPSIVIVSGRGDGTFVPALTIPVGENPVARSIPEFPLKSPAGCGRRHTAPAMPARCRFSPRAAAAFTSRLPIRWAAARRRS